MARWTDELARTGAVGVPVPAQWADPLRKAQTEVTNTIRPNEYRAVEAQLMALRMSTVTRNETAQEAKASFQILATQLVDIPADILAQACDAYTRAPGTRFFPRAAGEILAFANPILHDRKRLAHRLGLMADEAERARSEAAKLEGDQGQYTLDELRRIPRHMRQTAVRKNWATQAMCDQLDAEDISGSCVEK